MNSSPRHSTCPQQCQQELNEIGDHHGPQSTGNGVSEHQGGHDDQQHQRVGEATGCLNRLIGDDAQCRDHLAHGEEGITDADAVHR